MAKFKECRRNQVIDVGDRVLVYHEKLREKVIKIDGSHIILTDYGLRESSLVIKVTDFFINTEDGAKYPRIYSEDFKRCGTKLSRDFHYKAFSTK